MADSPFLRMKGAKSSATAGDDEAPHEVSAPVETAYPSDEEVPQGQAPAVDDDDLEVGAQLDGAAVTPEFPSVSDTASEPVAVSDDRRASETLSSDPAPSSPEASTTTDGGDASGSTEEHTLRNPNDPRLATSGSFGPREAELARQMAAARSSQSQGGGGAAIDGRIVTAAAAGLAGAALAGSGVGLAAAAGTLAAPSIGKGFKVLANKLPSIAPGFSQDGDLSRPAPMNLAERMANRDPVKAEQYYAKAGDRVIREKLYRDAFNGMNDAVHAAGNARSEWASAVSHHNATVAAAADRTQLKDMAAAANSSVGDYILALNSGTVSNAAAQNLLKTLGDQPEVKASAEKVQAVGRDFETASRNLMKNVETIDSNFEGRADTKMRKDAVENLLKDMKDEKPLDVDGKLKKVMEQLDELAKKFAEIAKAVVSKIADKLGMGKSA